jgi:hypothetical protein
MSGELSDCFENRAIGVKYILECIEKNILGKNWHVLGFDRFYSVEEAKNSPYKIGGANWVGTVLMVADIIQTGILIDIGSTTTDIIPFSSGKLCSKGTLDHERLYYNELVYTGVIRSNISSILASVKLSNKVYPLANEYFAVTGDVYRVLNKISEEKYSCQTPDKRGKSYEECLARIARVICGDLNIFSKNTLTEIASQVMEAQVKMIKSAVLKVSIDMPTDVKYVVTGTGSFLGEMIIPDKYLINIDTLFGCPLENNASAIGAAYALKKELL